MIELGGNFSINLLNITTIESTDKNLVFEKIEWLDGANQ